MNERPSEDILYRFVDGECSPSEELDILTAERDDADLAARIRDIRAENAKLRAAMDLELQGELPEALSRAVTQPQRGFSLLPFRSAGFDGHGGRLLAASLVGAIALGTGWSHWRINHWQETVISLTEQREAALAGAIQQVLETNLSGDALEISAPDLEFTAVVQPEETYKSTSGHWCRKFTEHVQISGRDFMREAIACRENGASNWTRVKTVIDGAVEGQLVLSGFDTLTN